jgi:hypothetical protein
VLDPRLDRDNGMPGVALVPDPVEVLGHHAELDDEVRREVLRSNLAQLLLPKPDQGLLVLPHDDPGIGAADEVTAVRNACDCIHLHALLHRVSCPNTSLSAYDMKNSISDRKVNARAKPLTSAQIRAARALLRWTAEDLANASTLSVATIRRAELTSEETLMTAANDLAVRRTLEEAGVEFIDENGGGPGVRLRKPAHERPLGLSR